MQASFALGFLGIAADLANILRVYLVNPTYGTERYAECPSARDELSARPRPPCSGAYPGAPPAGTPDHPRTRAWGRRAAGLTNLAFLAASVPGAVVNGQYDPAPTASNRVMTLRSVSLVSPSPSR